MSARVPGSVLLGFVNAAAWKAIDQSPALGAAAPALANFDDAAKALVASSCGDTNNNNNELLNRMIYNKVRVCPVCNKPNGFTLKNCNSCGGDISATALSKTLNVFSGFMLSIGKSTFPLTVSLRVETPTHIVLDDLLALSPCHVNVIPTKQFIPDWRFLLRRPAEGVAVTKQLKDLAVQAVRESFLSNSDWLKQFTSVDNEKNPFVPEQDLSMGFNFPPSQNQLHLQCIFPVVLPYQFYLFEKGTHFTPGRFFPYEFVLQALACAQERPLPAELLHEDTPIEAIVDHFRRHHTLDAEVVRRAFCDRFERNFNKFQAWDKKQFQFVAKEEQQPTDADAAGGKGNNAVLQLSANPDAATQASGDAAIPSGADAITALVSADKLALQSYGRPYMGGKPQGKFYQFPAKSVDQMDFW